MKISYLIQLLVSIISHSFIKSWFCGMQQFSFDPAPFNQFNKYSINIYILYKGMSFTLRQIRINGNLSESKWYIYSVLFLYTTEPMHTEQCLVHDKRNWQPNISNSYIFATRNVEWIGARLLNYLLCTPVQIMNHPFKIKHSWGFKSVI